MDQSAYFEHLSDSDIALLVHVSETTDSEGFHEMISAYPNALCNLLASDDLYDVLFGSDTQDVWLKASPFLIFAVLVSRANTDLSQARFFHEWIGPDQRVPVFGVDALRDFSSDASHQFFLAQVLASYTRVASGTFWVHTPRGWRRHRYSDLDITRLVEMISATQGGERTILLRRLGDLALFLTGVFPDTAAARPFRPGVQKRLKEVVAHDINGALAMGHGATGIDFLEFIGTAAYRQASADVERNSGSPGNLRDMADGFGNARRVLNFMAEQYFFPLRSQWFPEASA